MFGGFGNNGFVVTGGYTPELKAIIARAVAMGYQLPTRKNLDLMDELIIGLKAASVTGDLTPYIHIKVYATDVIHAGGIPTDFGFDGINWANPTENQSIRFGTGSKISKRGYLNSGGFSIRSNYAPSDFSSVIQPNDQFWYQMIADLDPSAVTQQSGGDQATDRRMWLQIAGNPAGIFVIINNVSSATPSNLTFGDYSVYFNCTPTGSTMHVNGSLMSSRPVVTGNLMTILQADGTRTTDGTNSNNTFTGSRKVSWRVHGKATQVNRLILENAFNTYFNKLQQLP